MGKHFLVVVLLATFASLGIRLFVTNADVLAHKAGLK